MLAPDIKLVSMTLLKQAAVTGFADGFVALQTFLFNTLQCTGESAVTMIADFMSTPVNPAAFR